MRKHGFRRAPWCYIRFDVLPWLLCCDRCGESEIFTSPVTLLGTLDQCRGFADRHRACGTDAPEEVPILPPTGQIGVSEIVHREVEERLGRDPIWPEIERLFVIFPEPSHLKIWICGHPPGYYEDDIPGLCSRCQTPIVHRPWFPKDAVTMCVACAAAPGSIE